MQNLTKSLNTLSTPNLDRLALFESTGFNLRAFADAAKLSTLNALKFIDEPEVQAALDEYDQAFDAVFTRTQKHAHLVALKSLTEALTQSTDPVERRRIANLLLRFTAARIKSLPAPAPADASPIEHHAPTKPPNHINLPTIPFSPDTFLPTDPTSQLAYLTTLRSNLAASMAYAAGNINTLDNRANSGKPASPVAPQRTTTSKTSPPPQAPVRSA